MRGNPPCRLFVLLIALVVAVPAYASIPAGQQVTIATGGETGVYYALGQAVCRLLNRNLVKHSEQCQAELSSGGVANVRAILSGQSTFAVIQSSHYYKALNGLPPFDKGRGGNDLRALFSLHNEVFTILARRDAAIYSFEDLKGKRLNVGNSGSGQRDTLEEIMQLKGWDHSVFAVAAELEAAEQSAALGDRNIDAMIYFVGHPNAALEEAISVIDARMVAVEGKVIDQLLASKPYYIRAEVPGGLYHGSLEATPSIGAKAIFATTSKTDPETVYQLVKEVFENLDRLRYAHPALANLNEQDMLQTGHSASLHEGAVRYYKERGWM